MDTREVFEEMPDRDLLEEAATALEVVLERKIEIPEHLASLVIGQTAEVIDKEPLDTDEQGQPEEPESPEQVEPLALKESLLGGFDTAFQTYKLMIDVANANRTRTKRHTNPEPLTAIGYERVLVQVERLLNRDKLVGELQKDIDYHTESPYAKSSKPGFDLVTTPKRLSHSDNTAFALHIQDTIGTGEKPLTRPFVRPEDYNDTRIPALSGHSYTIAFTPRHYNVPKAAAIQQGRWLKDYNKLHIATRQTTATDAQAMAFINNLKISGQLENPASSADQTYFQRFDQKPVYGFVSQVVCVNSTELKLDAIPASSSHLARVLFVPRST